MDSWIRTWLTDVEDNLDPMWKQPDIWRVRGNRALAVWIEHPDEDGIISWAHELVITPTHIHYHDYYYDYDHFGECVEDHMEELGLSQEELVEREICLPYMVTYATLRMKDLRKILDIHFRRFPRARRPVLHSAKDLAPWIVSMVMQHMSAGTSTDLEYTDKLPSWPR